MKQFLSVVLSVHNEEKLIEDALKSIKNLADEIIIVDNESTNNVIKISKKYTDKIYKHKNNPLVLNQAKNHGFSKATGDWILSLDPDERISPELAGKIKQLLNRLPTTDYRLPLGYWIPRRNIVFGKWIQHGIWYPDKQLRLFKKGHGKFPEKHNHEYLEVDGETADLNDCLTHENYQTVTQFVNKLNNYYTDNEVKNFIESGKKIYWYDAIRMPASDFILNFFRRQSYKDGLHGLVLSLLQAFYALIVFAKVWEKQGFWEYNSQNFTKDVKSELNSKSREFSWWYTREIIPWFLKPKQIIKKIIRKI